MSAKSKVKWTVPPFSNKVFYAVHFMFFANKSKLFELVHQVALAARVYWGYRLSRH